MLTWCLAAIVILQSSTAVTIDCPAHLWGTAESLYKQRRHYEKSLRRIHNVKESDAAGNFFREFPIDPENIDTIRKADVIVEYKELLRNRIYSRDDRCKVKPVQDFNRIVEQYAHCVPKSLRCVSRNVSCNERDRWRTYDGSCNNLKNWKWGAMNMPYNHMLGPCFHDGINAPRLAWNTNEELISPRIVGNYLADFCNNDSHAHTGYKEIQISLFAAMFGQLITHDCSSRATVEIEGHSKQAISCCSSSYDKPLPIHQRSPQCLPINVPDNDKYYGACQIGCLNFVRAQPGLANDCKLGGSPFLNLVSGHLDLSVVYGKSVENANAMRAFSGGCFNLSYDQCMPTGPAGILTGDGRATQTTWLAICHSMWYKLHNYIANGLAKCNRQWDDQRLFEEARRITIACYERIIYNEWLPTFLGPDYCRRKNLTYDRRATHCGQYDPNIDASVNNEFAHGAMRKFHSYVPKIVNLYSENGRKFKTMRLTETVDKPEMIGPNYLSALRGMLYDPIASKCMAYTEELRSHLFASKKFGLGIDLMSLDLMRGRDVGIQPYIKYFERCVGITILCWRDLEPFISHEYLPLLREIYENVEDIDLLVGILAEKRVYGHNGPIGVCILGEQFHSFKFGNRFFYEFEDGPHSFTTAQIAAINQVTCSKMLCWATGLKQVATRSMEIPNASHNPLQECKAMNPFNFNVFKSKT